MKIGELAKETNCHVETIRYYQKVGLLFSAEKLPNGYGYYSKKHLAHLRLIRRAKKLGFSQREISEMVTLAESQQESCSSVHALTQAQLKNVVGRISELNQIKEALEVLLVSCDNNTLDNCPTLTELLGAEPGS